MRKWVNAMSSLLYFTVDYPPLCSYVTLEVTNGNPVRGKWVVFSLISLRLLCRDEVIIKAVCYQNKDYILYVEGLYFVPC